MIVMHLRVALVLALLTACGPSLRQPRTIPQVSEPGADPVPDPSRGGITDLELEPVQIQVIHEDEGTTRTIATDARTLFEEGNDALMQRRYQDALERYDALVHDFPGSQLVGPAYYNAGLACEGKDDFITAADRYREAWSRATTGNLDKREAGMRLGAVLAESRQYGESVKIFEAFLALDGLTQDERLEGLTRLGYALVEVADYTGAEEVLRQALVYFKDQGAKVPFDSNYYAAMAQFYLAVIPHRQFRAVPLRYPEEQMARDLEHKSNLFLIAYDRYMMLLKNYPNRYWTGAGIYQLGVMHKEFWDAFYVVPMPPQLDAAGRKEYVKLFNKNEQLSKLLEKSLFFHEKNVVLNRAGGIDSVWVQASEVRAKEVRTLVARQAAGELFPPGTVPGGATRGGDQDPLGQRTHAEDAPDYVPGRTEI
jgi:tetratricopeptide (TPR) repeat protein